MKCDELKVYHCNEWHNEYTEFYIKSDVDATLAEKDSENRRLKRALYKACANWANLEVFDRTVGIDDPNVEANRWALMRNKCIKKVEEYK